MSTNSPHQPYRFPLSSPGARRAIEDTDAQAEPALMGRRLGRVGRQSRPLRGTPYPAQLIKRHKASLGAPRRWRG